jgi:gamma-glutamyl hercynylcysteine S-oxide synthase
MSPVRPASRSRLGVALEHARERTEALLEPLTDEELTRQFSPLQSPLVWDLAHIGYFEELWLLRGGEAGSSARDGLYDPAAHARAERGELPILSPAEARAYLAEVRSEVLERLPGLDAFLVAMVVQHELQHGETMTQTLALARLPLPHPAGPPEVEAVGDVLVPAGVFTLGSTDPWAYDNERPPQTVELPSFRIDRALVTNAEYAAFVEAEGANAPLRRGLPRDPVQHVSFYEAEAYAHWAGKRLPTEPEWEKAVKTVGPELEHVSGAVWQWTSSSFDGYAGFRAVPYREYSEPFFGDEYKVLRGGSWATDPLVARSTFRNWDLPQRRQIFSGIRCASDA